MQCGHILLHGLHSIDNFTHSMEEAEINRSANDFTAEGEINGMWKKHERTSNTVKRWQHTVKNVMKLSNIGEKLDFLQQVWQFSHDLVTRTRWLPFLWDASKMWNKNWKILDCEQCKATKGQICIRYEKKKSNLTWLATHCGIWCCDAGGCKRL